MNRCFVLLAFVVLGGWCVMAQTTQVIRNGNFTRRGYWLRQEQQVTPGVNGVAFNGKDSVVWIKLNKFQPPIQSFSLVAEVTVAQLPANGTAVIAARPGYHNILGVDATGRVSFSIYGQDKKSRKLLYSRTKVTPGTAYRIAAVIERIGEGEYDLSLYVNGVREGHETLYQEIYNYDRDYFYLGAIGFKHTGPFFHGAIKNLWVAPAGLDKAAMDALK